MIYLANAFSLQMADVDRPLLVDVYPMSAGEVSNALDGGFTSAVGHADTAAVLSGLLGIDIPANRVNITLTPVDVLIVAQVIGGRLPEGATTLPDGIQIKFLNVRIQYQDW